MRCLTYFSEVRWPQVSPTRAALFRYRASRTENRLVPGIESGRWAPGAERPNQHRTVAAVRVRRVNSDGHPKRLVRQFIAGGLAADARSGCRHSPGSNVPPGPLGIGIIGTQDPLLIA